MIYRTLSHSYPKLALATYNVYEFPRVARILYAVSGDGFGHATRAHSVADGLLARGHDVRFIASLRSQSYLDGIYPGRVTPIFGLCLTYHQGRVQNLRTVLDNIRRAWKELGSARRNIQSTFREFRPQLIVTDFEPITAFFAKRFCVPFVSLDNQHLLTHCDVELPPGLVRDLVSAYLTVRLYYGGARRYLIPTFIKAPVRHHPTTLVDPILRTTVYEKRSREGSFLLAYKGAGGENDAMRETLERHARMPIRAYGFGITGRRGRVTFRSHNRDGFLHDLSGCAGVIMSAGHSLACECLHLDKPMLAVPIGQQFEQAVNAYHVEKLGAGRRADKLTPESIDDFVDRLDIYRDRIRALPKASLATALDSIEREIP